jgi:hypothetical protein
MRASWVLKGWLPRRQTHSASAASNFSQPSRELERSRDFPRPGTKEVSGTIAQDQAGGRALYVPSRATRSSILMGGRERLRALDI